MPPNSIPVSYTYFMIRPVRGMYNRQNRETSIRNWDRVWYAPPPVSNRAFIPRYNQETEKESPPAPAS